MANKSIYNAFERMWQHITAFISNKTSKQTMVDMIYPVGSIYISLSETNPFENCGVWKKIESETFLMSAGIEETSLGQTGGSNTSTLTLTNIPYHTHTTTTFTTYDNTVGPFASGSGIFISTDDTTTGRIVDGTVEGETPESFSNMPKYLAVNMWQRIS